LDLINFDAKHESRKPPSLTKVREVRADRELRQKEEAIENAESARRRG